jgi:hypothetical protein
LGLKQEKVVSILQLVEEIKGKSGRGEFDSKLPGTVGTIDINSRNSKNLESNGYTSTCCTVCPALCGHRMKFDKRCMV